MAFYLPSYDLAQFTNATDNKYSTRLIVVMNAFPKGTNVKFPVRDVTKDMDIICVLAKQLKLDASSVKIVQDQTEEEMHALFKNESERKELNNVGMLMVILLSHGCTGHIYDSKGKPVEVDKLIEYFRGMSCSALVGKPKVFIVQACEENLYHRVDYGERTEADSGGEKPIEKFCIPAEADVLMIWSPIPGNIFWRQFKETGSLFISKLILVLKDENCTGMEIRKLVIQAINLVCQELEEKAPKQFKDSGYRLPYIIDMLTKELYFHTVQAVQG